MQGFGTSNNRLSMSDQVAPFVAKTYQMVSDPRMDSLIKWGKENNSFLVLNPTDFSRFLLPFYFKHSNFSSFVRQLNTYGFRKVDPDKWEFAHQCFLRGQTQLLPHVTRRTRKSHSSMCATTSSSSSNSGGDGITGDKTERESAQGEAEQEVLLLQEVHRLRQEQRVLDQELRVMSKRLQDTERKPRQMMSFLIKVAEDPQLLSRLVDLNKEQCSASAAAKKRRLDAPCSPAPCPTKCSDGVFSQSILVPGIEQQQQQQTVCGELEELVKQNFALVPDVCEPSSSTCHTASEISFVHEFGLSKTSWETAVAAPTFPFSMLGHGFY